VNRLQISSLLRLYRVREWVHILPLPLATFDTAAPLGIALVAAARGIANAFAILAFGFLLNAVFDRHVDRDAHKNPLILSGAADYRSSLVALPAVSLVLAALSPWPALVATLVCLILGCVYSTGPRLKSVPVAGSLINAAGFTPILFLGMASPSLPPRFGYVTLAFAALLLQNQLIHEAGDQIEDRASGIRTTWLTLGPRWTALFAALAGSGAAIGAVCVVPKVEHAAMAGVLGASFVIAFPLLLASRGLTARQAARLRVVHRWCAVVVGTALYITWRSGA
jgi:4-hydroxybenzoate polyprenyltransferase